MGRVEATVPDSRDIRPPLVLGLTLLLAAQVPDTAWATGDTGFFETGDTGTFGDTGEPEPSPEDTGISGNPTDTGTQDTGVDVPDPEFGTPSAAQLAGELGGFRCDVRSSPSVPAARTARTSSALFCGLLGLLTLLLRRRA